MTGNVSKLSATLVSTVLQQLSHLRVTSKHMLAKTCMSICHTWNEIPIDLFQRLHLRPTVMRKIYSMGYFIQCGIDFNTDHRSLRVYICCRLGYFAYLQAATCKQNGHSPPEVSHNDGIKWKHFPRYWSFVRGIHRSPVNSPHKASDAELWSFLWSALEQTVE